MEHEIQHIDSPPNLGYFPSRPDQDHDGEERHVALADADAPSSAGDAALLRLRPLALLPARHPGRPQGDRALPGQRRKRRRGRELPRPLSAVRAPGSQKPGLTSD